MTAMTILNPIAAIIYMVHLGINIAMLFAVIRLILTWKHFAWLAHFDTVGKPLVDGMINAVGKFVETRWHKKLSEKGNLLACLVVLATAELILTCFFNLCL
jgi:hypothetical protein